MSNPTITSIQNRLIPSDMEGAIVANPQNTPEAAQGHMGPTTIANATPPELVQDGYATPPDPVGDGYATPPRRVAADPEIVRAALARSAEVDEERQNELPRKIRKVDNAPTDGPEPTYRVDGFNDKGPPPPSAPGILAH